MPTAAWNAINAITLATTSLNASVVFYQKLSLSVQWSSKNFKCKMPLIPFKISLLAVSL